MPKRFDALPGFYYYFFLYLEPLSTIIPMITCLIYPGAEWFYNELIPAAASIPATSSAVDQRVTAVTWQLVNTYMLLCLLESFVFRAIRDTLPGNPVAQERILGACMGVFAFADITHTVISLVTTPAAVRFEFTKWNGMSHGNITFTILLFAVRTAWFLGVGRTRFYYGRKDGKKTA